MAVTLQDLQVLVKERRPDGHGPVIILDVRDLVVHQDGRPGTTANGRRDEARQPSLTQRLGYWLRLAGESDVPSRVVTFAFLTRKRSTRLDHDVAALPSLTDVFLSYARAARTLRKAASGP